MTEEAQIRSVALFFFFALPNESSAKQASVRTLRICQRKIKKEQLESSAVVSLLIHHTYRQWRKAWKRREKVSQGISYEAGWIIPEAIEIGAWRQFQKDGEPEELLAVIWSKILGFTDEDIALGLGLTVGTVRHRVGRGLRHLGALLSLRGDHG